MTAVGNKISVNNGTLPPDEDTPHFSWTYDLRTVTPFDKMGSNHDIEDNLVLAGLITPVPRGMPWNQAAYPKTDTEYSQFWMYFLSWEQLNQWVNDLIKYRDWLAESITFDILAKQYKEQCV